MIGESIQAATAAAAPAREAELGPCGHPKACWVPHPERTEAEFGAPVATDDNEIPYWCGACEREAELIKAAEDAALQGVKKHIRQRLAEGDKINFILDNLGTAQPYLDAVLATHRRT